MQEYSVIVNFFGILIFNMLTLEYIKILEDSIKSRNQGAYIILFICMGIGLLKVVEYDGKYTALLLVVMEVTLITFFEYFGLHHTWLRAVSSCAVIILSMFIAIVLSNILMIHTMDCRFEANLVLTYDCLYFAVLLSIKKLKECNLKYLSYKEWFVWSISVLVGIIIISLEIIFMGNSTSDFATELTAGVILAVIILELLLFYLMLQMNGQYVKEKMLMEKNQQYHFQNQYMKDNQKNDEQLRTFKHDMMNQLQVISSLVINNKTNEAIEYLKEYTGELNKKNQYVSTENEIVNSILNTKISYCKQCKIDVFFSVAKTMKQMDDIDLCSLLGNLLDNAIEYSQILPENQRYIECTIKTEDNGMSILIKNRISQSVLSDNENLNTSKMDKMNHGYGTKIVKEIVRKYRGDVDFYEKDGLFCVYVLL